MSSMLLSLIQVVVNDVTTIEKQIASPEREYKSVQADIKYFQKMYDDAREKVYELAKTGLFSYSNALYLLKMGKNITRKFWFWAGTKVFLRMITPSGTSENTETYTQMVKRIYDKEGVHLRTKLFPCVISDESIYSDDWCVVEFEYNEIVK